MFLQYGYTDLFTSASLEAAVRKDDAVFLWSVFEWLKNGFY